MSKTVATFLERCVGRSEVLTGAFDAELLQSEVMRIRVSGGKLGMAIKTRTSQYPDGKVIARFERELGRALGAAEMRLFLRPVSATDGEDGEDQLANARAVFAWMMDEHRYLPGALNCCLKAEQLQERGGMFCLEAPRFAAEDLDEDAVRIIERFLRERGGLRKKLRVKLAAECDAETQIEQSKAFMARVQQEGASAASRAAASNGAASGRACADGMDGDFPLDGQGDSQSGAGNFSRANRARSTKGSGSRGGKEKRYHRQKLADCVWGRIYELRDTVPLGELTGESGLVQIAGQALRYQAVPSKSGNYVCKFDLCDRGGAVSCVLFARSNEIEALNAALKGKAYIHAEAEVSFDSRFTRDLQAKILGFVPGKVPQHRTDEATEKRVELHCHTKMSAQDAVTDASTLVELAARFGHSAVAITDHGVAQAFPEAYETMDRLREKGRPIKLIYGLEGYLVDDGTVCVYGDCEDAVPERFVALDVETTGLDPLKDRLIEIGARRFVLGTDGAYQEEETFHSLINPAVSLPPKITQLTGITDLDLIGAPEAFPVLRKLREFMGDAPLVAHNALFDLGFLRAEGFRTPEKNAPRLKFNPPLIDTLALARCFLPDLRHHTLDSVAAALAIPLERHHRALDDALCCGRIFAALHKRLGHPTLAELNRRAGQVAPEQFMTKKYPVYHIILLVQNELGLYHLYRLISEAHTRYFSRRPRIPRSLLTYLRHGLLLGSACEAGEIFRNVRKIYIESGKNMDAAFQLLQGATMRDMARFYDYLEVQPLGNNHFLVNKPDTGILGDNDLMNLNRLVLGLGKIAKRPVAATCDVHFLNPEDAIYRRIMLSNMGFDADEEQAELYFRNTDEMLCEFAYLGEEQAREIVVRNPTAIAARVEDGLRPFPQGSFPPKIPEAEEEVERLSWTRARALYDPGTGLPEIVESRLKRELDSIISNGFAVMYYIAHKLVKQANDDGYVVGSRGSVGSSLVATFCGITEVNPLVPHYHCKKCRYSEFDTSGTYSSGYDLPDKICPNCGAELTRDGQDIPFETFLGFNGDKQPDIDLNFSGEYQSKAHLYIREMFGHSHTFRAGTIGCYAEKNAEGLVRAYLEAEGRQTTWADIRRLSAGLIGVKRTTGQHPGGIVVIPREREVYDFTAVQYPADKTDANMRTTHFDFNAMHDTILKLDILGHDDPTMIKELCDMTGVNVRDIPIMDAEVMRLFASREPLRYVIDSEQTDGTLGLPEMGTFMAREMIRETKPKHFFDLVQLSGLSHGTDVWKGNAQDLIRGGVCDIGSVIGCRDGIMTTLIHGGLPKKEAFDIMERVRKGKGLLPEQQDLMRECHIAPWYIDSCKKIKYMFPKAHAVAYVIYALRIGWFKVYRPEAYYATFYTVRADEFDISLMGRGLEQTIVNRQAARRKMQERDANPRDKSVFYILELVEEMYCRGIEFLPISLEKSAAGRFLVEQKGKIRPPFNVIPGFSLSMGEAVVAAREQDGVFHCKDELARRAQLGAAAMEALNQEGVLAGLPNSAQIDLQEWANMMD